MWLQSKPHANELTIFNEKSASEQTRDLKCNGHIGDLVIIMAVNGEKRLTSTTPNANNKFGESPSERVSKKHAQRVGPDAATHMFFRLHISSLMILNYSNIMLF